VKKISAARATTRKKKERENFSSRCARMMKRFIHIEGMKDILLSLQHYL